MFIFYGEVGKWLDGGVMINQIKRLATTFILTLKLRQRSISILVIPNMI